MNTGRPTRRPPGSRLLLVEAEPDTQGLLSRADIAQSAEVSPSVIMTQRRGGDSSARRRACPTAWIPGVPAKLVSGEPAQLPAAGRDALLDVQAQELPFVIGRQANAYRPGS